MISNLLLYECNRMEKQKTAEKEMECVKNDLIVKGYGTKTKDKDVWKKKTWCIFRF